MARRRRLAKVMGRRRISRQLDQLLHDHAELPNRNHGSGGCTGEHHPDLGCDWWGPCTGAAYTVAEHRRLRAGVAA